MPRIPGGPGGDITTILLRLRTGDSSAEQELIPLVYPELRRLASRYLRDEQPGHTLQATALVHELYLRMSSVQEIDWKGRGQFIAVAAQMMRRILIDHARRRHAAKRDDRSAPIAPRPLGF